MNPRSLILAALLVVGQVGAQTETLADLPDDFVRLWKDVYKARMRNDLANCPPWAGGRTVTNAHMRLMVAQARQELTEEKDAGVPAPAPGFLQEKSCTYRPKVEIAKPTPWEVREPPPKAEEPLATKPKKKVTALKKTVSGEVAPKPQSMKPRDALGW